LHAEPHEGMYGGEHTPGVDYVMPPLERDEHDEPASSHESHENVYGAERTPGIDYEMPPLERDERDAPASELDPHTGE
jgi:hypothetical protein